MTKSAILVGLDDTDMPGTPGTNQLAKSLVRDLAGRFRLVRIVRHQLLADPRVPFTSKNGSASILLRPESDAPLADLIATIRHGMQAWYVPGSDPGFCVAPCDAVPAEVVAFGRLCQRALVDQAQARALATSTGLHLEGLGGTEGGVIGALAAVGLARTDDDGRVVQHGGGTDDLSGPQDLATLAALDVMVCQIETGAPVVTGPVDVGKHLRPNLRQGRVVLHVQSTGSEPVPWRAVRLP